MCNFCLFFVRRDVSFDVRRTALEFALSQNILFDNRILHNIIFNVVLIACFRCQRETKKKKTKQQNRIQGFLSTN